MDEQIKVFFKNPNSDIIFSNKVFENFFPTYTHIYLHTFPPQPRQKVCKTLSHLYVVTFYLPVGLIHIYFKIGI